MRAEGLTKDVRAINNTDQEYDGPTCFICGEPTQEIEKLFPSDVMPSGVRSQMVRVCTDPDCSEYDPEVENL